MLKGFLAKIKSGTSSDEAENEKKEEIEKSKTPNFFETAKSKVSDSVKSMQDFFTTNKEETYPAEKTQPPIIYLPEDGTNNRLATEQSQVEKRAYTNAWETIRRYNPLPSQKPAHSMPNSTIEAYHVPPKRNPGATMPQKPLYTGGVPKNFWRDIAHYPYNVSSYDYEHNPELRKDIKRHAIAYQRSRRK